MFTLYIQYNIRAYIHFALLVIVLQAHGPYTVRRQSLSGSKQPVELTRTQLMYTHLFDLPQGLTLENQTREARMVRGTGLRVPMWLNKTS